jgi:esterase
MKLFHREIGDGPAILLLHGVFGSGDNLYTVSKQIAEAGYKVYLLDARNHGLSPHSTEHNYEAMGADLYEFIIDQNLNNPVIIGHSMGGKTVMQYSQQYDNFSKLAIIDIAPRFYPTHHSHILEGLAAIDLNKMSSRKDAEEIFAGYVSDFGERQFILKNLYRTENGKFDWRINVNAISENIEQIGSEIELSKKIDSPTLFVKGELSSYINEEDEKNIKAFYTNAYIVEIKGANHWVHATKPQEFVSTILSFLKL